jgi:H-type lectin domain
MIAAMAPIAPLALLSAVVPLNSSLPDWNLLEPGDGEPRRFSFAVSFAVPFSAPPVVQLGVVGVDADNTDNLRLKVRAEAISSTGFDLIAETWLHSRLWAVDVSWLAIGS